MAEMTAGQGQTDTSAAAGGPEGDVGRRLAQAVRRPEVSAKDAMLERVFAGAFQGLVYPQIWEDPVADMAALGISETAEGQRLFCIASGSCNVMSYLTAGPEAITAVDLSPAHVALGRLKLAAAQHLPTYAMFYRFFGDAAHADNPRVYRELLWEKLDADTRGYWDRLDLRLRPRIDLFRRGFYAHGLLGRTIGLGHAWARLHGVRLSHILEATSLEDQRAIFEAEIAPLFDRAFIRWLMRQKSSLFGLGIPPAQYEALIGSADGGDAEEDRMAAVLKSRLRKLLCDFPVSENYFAWQAAGRGYAPGQAGPLPPYLQHSAFEGLKANADRVAVENISATERLLAEAAESGPGYDAFVFLDAQDWMTDQQLNDLWSAVTAVARPGARVLFRTAPEPSLLPGRLAPALLDRWAYDEAASATATRADRSAIYGGVHLYRFRG